MGERWKRMNESQVHLANWDEAFGESTNDKCSHNDQ